MRKESHELQWLETVSQRKQLTEEQRRALQRSQKGFLGEQQMDQLAEMFLSGKVLVIDDITLRYQNTVVQIDKLLIIGNTIYVIDVKFY
ncbi:nuclease-related domain-containing protein, partial [Tetragenococcus halophilus]